MVLFRGEAWYLCCTLCLHAAGSLPAPPGSSPDTLNTHWDWFSTTCITRSGCNKRIMLTAHISPAAGCTTGAQTEKRCVFLSFHVHDFHARIWSCFNYWVLLFNYLLCVWLTSVPTVNANQYLHVIRVCGPLLSQTAGQIQVTTQSYNNAAGLNLIRSASPCLLLEIKNNCKKKKTEKNSNIFLFN